jgi:hypothetical protein
LVYFHANSQTRNHVIQLLTANYWPLRQTIKHFRHFCEDRAFQLWTGHKPLVTAISRVSAPISARQQRHLAFISEFNVQLLYLLGLKNVVADSLSRQTKQPLDQLPPRRRQIQWISKRWPLSKAAARNAALVGRHITKIGFPPDRHSMPGWRCFHRQFLPYCPPQIQKNHLW